MLSMILGVAFWIFLIGVFGRLIFFSFKLCWKIFKVLFIVVFLPITLILLFLRGFVYLALIALVAVGVLSLITVGK